MTVHWWRNIDIKQQEFMDMVSILILNKEKGDHDCILGILKVIDFSVFVVKYSD